MAQRGTVQNGATVPDDPGILPDGTPVEMTAAEEEYPHPLAPFDATREAALLRDRVAAVRAGEATIPLDEAVADIARQFRAAPAGG